MISKALLLSIVGCLACGSNEVRMGKPLSPAVARLGMVLRTDTPNDPFVKPVVDSLSRHFVDAGYFIVQQESRQGQLLGTVSVTSRQEESILQIAINGQQSVSYDVTVQFTILGRDQEIVDQLQGRFSAKYGRADDDVAQKIVSEVRAHRKLEAYSKKIAHSDDERMKREAREREANRQREAQAREEEKRTEAEAIEKEKRTKAEALEAERLRRETALVVEAKADDEDWNASDAPACRLGTMITSCDGIVGYVKKRSEGKHIGEAKEALEEGAPRIAILIDNKDWKEASFERCQYPATGGDCNGVQDYVKKHPEGAHVTKARSILNSSAGKIEAFRAKAILRANASQSIEELCQSLVQLDSVEQAERRQHRVDVESGTVNLYERRNITAARVYLQDRTKQLSDQIARSGVQFNRRRDCTADE